jgi:hypothetical protein
MPNRKTFDEKEKYDHSGHPLAHRQAGDLKPDVNVDLGAGADLEAAEGSESAATSEAHARDVVHQSAANVRRKPRTARRTG